MVGTVSTLGPPAARDTGPRHSRSIINPLLIRTAHVVVLVCLAAMMSGIERYFAFWSPSLHYGFDAMAVAAAAVALMGIGQGRAFMRSVWLGMVFALVYFSWGLLVSSHRDALQPATTSAMVLAALAMTLVTVSFHDRSTLARLASVACFVSMFTFAMMVYELGSPSFIARIAQARGSIYDYTGRPSGFWPNPNDAAVMLVVCLIVSNWSGRSWIAWLGRVTAVLGVYLSGSREAFYPLLLAVIVLVVRRLVKVNPTTGRQIQLGLVASAVAVVMAVGVALLILAQIGGSDVLQSSLARMLDFSQSQSNLTYNPSRLYLVQQWWPVAVHNPWYGGGIYSFQGNGTIEVLGAHDLYLTIFGEDGLLMLGLYVALLGFSLWQILALVRSGYDRILALLLYGFWIFEGFVNHAQFSDPAFTIFLALLLRIPVALMTTMRQPPLAVQSLPPTRGVPQPTRTSRTEGPARGDRSATVSAHDVHPWTPITHLPS